MTKTKQARVKAKQSKTEAKGTMVTFSFQLRDFHVTQVTHDATKLANESDAKAKETEAIYTIEGIVVYHRQAQVLGLQHRVIVKIASKDGSTEPVTITTIVTRTEFNVRMSNERPLREEGLEIPAEQFNILAREAYASTRGATRLLLGALGLTADVMPLVTFHDQNTDGNMVLIAYV